MSRRTPPRMPAGYRVESVLKSDGERVVAIAHPADGGDRVVLKVVGPRAEEMARVRFHDVIRLQGDLVHPGICPIINVGRTPDGGVFAVYPYVKTVDPAAWTAVDRKTRFPLVVRALSEPVAFLHEHGHVHGDLKPSNILFRAEEGEIRDLLLTDFLPPLFFRGDRLGTIAGTLGYLAPEAIRGNEPDHRSDLYSLGATLHEILTGSPLFTGSAEEVAWGHLSARPRVGAPREWNLPARWNEALERLLAKSPADRPQTARDFLADFFDEKPGSGRVTVVARPPLVGRDSLLEEMRDWSSLDDRPCLALRGEKGWGKTRLLREFSLQLRLDGEKVAFLSVPEAVCDRPYEGARLLLAAISADPLRWDLGRIASSPRRSGTAGSSGELSLFRAIYRIWEERIAGFADRGGKPILVIVDNLDHFDDSSLRFFRFLLDRDGPPPVRFLASIGSVESPQLSSLLDRFEERGLLRTLMLEVLSDSDVEEWIRGVLGNGKVDPGLTREAVRRSGGVPARLEGLARRWIARGRVRRKYGSFTLSETPAPGDDAGAGEESAVGLDPAGLPPRAALLAAAVALSPIAGDAPFYRRLLGVPEEDWPVLVNALVGRGWIRIDPDPAGDRYSLKDEAFRPALAGMISADTRTKLHRAAARLRAEEEKRGVEGASLIVAHHLAGAGSFAAARRKLMKAAEGMERLFLFRDAARLYRRASAVDPGSIAPGERAKLLLRLAETRFRAGETRGARAAARLLLAWGRDRGIDRSTIIRAGLLDAWIFCNQGNPGRAEKKLRALLSPPEGLSPRDRAAILRDLGWALLDQNRKEEAGRALRSGLEALKGTRERVLKGQIFNRLGAIAYNGHDWARAITFYRRAVRVLEGTAPGEAVPPLSNLALIYYWTGRLRDARESMERTLRIARETGNLIEEARISEDLARVFARLGRWEEAGRLFHEAFVTFREYGESAHEATTLLSMGHAARERGRLVEALRLSEDGLRIGRRIVKPMRLVDGLNLLALCHIAREEPDRAEAVLAEIESLAPGGLGGRQLALNTRTRGRLARLRGSYDEAEVLFEEALRLFKSQKAKLNLVETLLMIAACRLDRGTGRSPLESLRYAERAMKREEYPLFAVRLRLLKGRYEESRGRIAEAEALYRGVVRDARRLDLRIDLAESLARLGAVFAAQGAKRRAKRRLEEAKSLYDRIRFVTPPPFLSRLLASLPGREEALGESFQTICRISEVINSRRDEEQVLAYVLDQAVDYLGAERGLILLREPDGRLLPRKARSLEGENLADVSRFSRTVFGMAERSEEPFVTDNALRDERFSGAESVASFSILSVICAPIRSRDRLIGAIYLDHRETEGVFSPRDVRILEALSHLTGIAFENARYRRLLESENEMLREEIDRREHVHDIVTESPVMKGILDRLRRAARGRMPILLLGETGVGKSLIAGFIHEESDRRDKAFRSLNTTAIPETLFESEVFGSERGAFSGADQRRIGAFERADGGTLFLDEIGGMKVETQKKLLRALQDGTFERLGGSETLRSDVRLISATNQDLQSLIARGLFRSDLLYRINAETVTIPPLRERREDIIPLARAFLKKHARENRRPVRSISDEVLSLFLFHHWPGNVRELDSAIVRAVSLCDGERIEVRDLPEHLSALFPSMGAGGSRSKKPEADLGAEMRDIERGRVLDALRGSDWNNTAAAKKLGVHESTVRKKRKQYGLDRFRPKSSPPDDPYDHTNH
ncbi:MAG: sigma 54-interacting transcriptional regulator [Candidatus Eisenbacteria bacterium]|nr:sigma 54-interacting transcriptional regulator [Candidatus Eisenbacteria bacterium]